MINHKRSLDRPNEYVWLWSGCCVNVCRWERGRCLVCGSACVYLKVCADEGDICVLSLRFIHQHLGWLSWKTLQHCQPGSAWQCSYIPSTCVKIGVQACVCVCECQTEAITLHTLQDFSALHMHPGFIALATSRLKDDESCQRVLISLQLSNMNNRWYEVATETPLCICVCVFQLCG